MLRLTSQPNQPPSKLAAIVVPLSTRPSLTDDEQISLRHLNHFLGRYDKYLVIPRRMSFALPGFGVKKFPDRFFGSAAAHGKMITSPSFFQAFGEYKYILMYHLDSLVFSDRLSEWCATGLDYVGPPWINCPDSPWVDRERVGNSGFALMKTASFLKVLFSNKPSVDPDQYWQEYYASKPKLIRYLNLPKRYLKRLPVFNSPRWHMYRWLQGRPEADIFWADEAIHYYPDFKIADVATGLRFAFEVSPRLCLERNHGEFPFGCHAWARYDRAFWEPHLLKNHAEVEKNLVAQEK